MSNYLNNGCLALDDLRQPTEKRFAQGAVAVIECVQEIPCNPCCDACPRGAITMGDSINNTPVIDFELCNGCGICVSNCPGLAIFLIEKEFEDNREQIGIPCEFLPLPEEGETVDLLNRMGKICGKGNAKTQHATDIKPYLH